MHLKRSVLQPGVRAVVQKMLNETFRGNIHKSLFEMVNLVRIEFTHLDPHPMLDNNITSELFIEQSTVEALVEEI